MTTTEKNRETKKRCMTCHDRQWCAVSIDPLDGSGLFQCTECWLRAYREKQASRSGSVAKTRSFVNSAVAA